MGAELNAVEDAIAADDFDAVRRWYEGRGEGWRDRAAHERWLPLCHATSSTMASLLLSYGESATGVKPGWNTPLHAQAKHAAVAAGRDRTRAASDVEAHLDCMRLLVAAGANPETRGDGRTLPPLFYAVASVGASVQIDLFDRVARALVEEFGAAPNPRDGHGKPFTLPPCPRAKSRGVRDVMRGLGWRPDQSRCYQAVYRAGRIPPLSDILINSGPEAAGLPAVLEQGRIDRLWLTADELELVRRLLREQGYDNIRLEFMGRGRGGAVGVSN